MANEYLYKSRDALGNVIYTASKEDTDGKPVTRVEFKEPQSMVLTGSIVDQRGLAANKPVANTVSIGTTYWSVDIDPLAMKVEVSDGTKWVVMA